MIYPFDEVNNFDLQKIFISVLLTHAYERLVVQVIFEGFAPAFILSLGDNERSRKLPNAHSLGRYI